MSASYRLRLWNIISQSPYDVMTDLECWTAINTKNVPIIVSTWVSEREIIMGATTLAVGEAFMQKLETGAVSNEVLARAIKWFAPSEGGIDVGDEKMRSTLDSLVGLYGITQAEINFLKGFAEKNISPAEVSGLDNVALGDIVMTREIYT